MATEAPRRDPFVGPVPFERKDADLFFGRAGEVRELVSRIVANRVVVIYAASGAGKTSLLNAGVLPVLEREEHFEVLPSVRFSRIAAGDEGRREVDNVYVATTLSCWIDPPSESSEPGVDAPAVEAAEAPAVPPGTTIATFLAGREHRQDARGRRLARVVVFDQFEEIFTAYPEYWEHREGFFEQLAEEIEADRYLRVVLALREDYVAQLEPLLPLLPSHVRFRLERLGQDAAIEAVTGPVACAGRSFAPGVAEALVEDLQTLRVDVGADEPLETPGEFVEPVQLQVVCQSLWRELPPDVVQITEQHVDTSGDVDEVLQRFYNDVVEATAEAAHVRQGRLRQWIEDALITSVGTRNTIYRTGESTAEIPNTAIEALENRHLIRGDWRAGARWYELTHDRLIGPIQSSNRSFRDEISRRRLRRALVVVICLAALVLGLVVARVVTSGGSTAALTTTTTTAIRPPPRPEAELSISTVVTNLTPAGYRRLTGLSATSKGLGNLLLLQVASEGFRGKALVIRSSTVDAKSRRPIGQVIQTLVKPRKKREVSNQPLWVPLPSKPGYFAYSVTLRTQNGRVLGHAMSASFAKVGGTAVTPHVPSFPLEVSIAPRRSLGTVISEPAGIDCGDACSSEYERDTAVTLLALPTRKSSFKGWGGVCRGNRTPQCNVKVDRRTVAVARFGPPLVDRVVDTGGIGVRYRSAPQLDALVPGNGPAENERVQIYCYTTGEIRHDNRWWAKVAVAPDRYVPATYLARTHSGRAPDGPFC